MDAINEDSESPYREHDEEDEQTAKVKRRRSAGGQNTSSRRSRPRSSLACLHCRRRKVKCIMNEGKLPCNSCQSLQIACVLSRDGDRRKAGSREQVSALQDRLQFLESLVTGTQNPLARRQSSSQDLLGEEEAIVHARHLSIQSNEAGEVDAAQYQDLSSMETDRDGMLNDQVSNVNATPWNFDSASAQPQYQHENAGLDGPAVAPLSTAGSAQTDNGRLTPPGSEKETSRLDVDQDRGQVRFYGPTSNHHVHSREIQVDSDPVRPGDEIEIDSPTVRRLLLEIFWKVQPLSIVLIERYDFERGRMNGARSDYYSEFLENSLLACATRMSTSPDIRSLGSKYAERATALVTTELQDPHIASLIGFLLLSDFESTRGRNRLGYMYCGISSRLVFDLGLAESCEDLVAQGRLAPSESVSRHRLFLGTFVFDKLWSFYLGRPSGIPNGILASAERRMLENGWQPAPRIEAWVGLCRDMSEITEILNAPSPLDSEGIDRLNSLDERIQMRTEEMDPSLALRDHKISELAANAYGLHVQLLGIRIVLHRLLSKAVSKSTSPVDGPDHSQKVMHENAVRIARLISVYQQIFGVESIIVVMLDQMFVAAAVLISHVLQQSTYTAETDTHWLKTLAEILRKAQKHYPVTARMRSTLSGFVEKTPLAGMFGSWTTSNVDNGSQSQQQSLFQPPVELFGTDGAFAQHFGSRGQDQTLLENPLPFGEYGEHVTQDMDLRNMMSWVLSPSV